MPISILDYVKSIVGDKDTYPAADFYDNGVEMLGGCERCHATIGPWNAYPSTSGYWRCAECIGGDGFVTVDGFIRHEAETGRAVAWLMRLRQLQADGMDFDSALAQANAEADSDSEVTVCPDEFAKYWSAEDDSGEPWLQCPSCGGAGNIREIRDGTFECGGCGATWTL